MQRVYTLKKMIAATFAAALIGAVLMPGAAQATEDKALVWDSCANLKSWSPNADELDRRPTPTADGLLFKPGNLVHHPITMSTSKLKPGSFSASPTPDQNSFFSVEVRNNDNTGYATLRFNTGTGKWEMTTGGQQYVNADPSALVEMTTPAKSRNLISFGVGYTKNPPGSVETTVERVRFMGKAYPLTCKLTPTTKPTTTKPTATPTKTATSAPDTRDCAAYVYTGTTQTLCDRFAGRDKLTCREAGFRVTLVDKTNDPWGLDGSGGNIGTVGVGCESKPLHPKPSSSAATSLVAADGLGDNGSSLGGLPVTGAAAGGIAGGAAVLLAAGGVLFVMARRRKLKFTA